MAFDANNYVTPAAGGGFIVVVNGQSAGIFSTQSEAEQKYNSLTGQSNGATTTAPSGDITRMTNELRAAGYNGPWDAASVQAAYTRTVNGGAGTGGGSSFKLAGGIGQLDSYNQALQQEYLRQRLTLLEIPMMEQERELALKDLDLKYASLMGYNAGNPTLDRDRLNSQNWASIAQLLASKSGPMDWATYSQLLPNAAFGALTPGDSWEKVFVGLMNNTNPWGQVASATGQANTASQNGVWQLPQNLDFKAIQRAWDNAHIAAPQDPALNASSPGGAAGGDHPAEWWKNTIRSSIPGAPEPFVDAMYNQILANYKQAGWNLLVDMPNQPAPNYIQQAYNAWLPTQSTSQPAPTGTTAQRTATTVPFTQPISVSPQQWNQWTGTQQQMKLGEASYNGIDPKDWMTYMQRAWPTGTASKTTTWA